MKTHFNKSYIDDEIKKKKPNKLKSIHINLQNL